MIMRKTFKAKDFEGFSWHDNSLYGVSWKMDCKSDTNELILDIDYICEWICDPDKTCHFKVAPADLIFHNITDLKINIDCGDSDFQISLDGGIPISGISRKQIKNQKVCLDKPY